MNRHVLGATLFRNGDWDEAVATLHESIKLTGGPDAFNGLFLAMACWKLGQKATAREHLKGAVAWMADAKEDIRKQGWDDDLRRLHTEAVELVRADDKPDAK